MTRIEVESSIWKSARHRAAHEVHDLRLNYASLKVMAGLKPYEVSRSMGHVKVSTTDGIFARLYPVDYDDQIVRNENVVGSS